MIKEIIFIALTIYGEAGGESYIVKKGVADTIHYEMQQTGKSSINVCTNPKRYSCWLNKSKMQRLQNDLFLIDRIKAVKPLNATLIDQTRAINRYDQEWLNCIQLAKNITNDNYLRFNNWTHFYNPNKVNPKWSKKLKNTKNIGNLRFGIYKE
jgi:hypothetical protein